MTFDVETRDGGVAVVVPTGTVLGGPEGAALHECLQAGEPSPRAVLDLSPLTLVNSSGLGQLVATLTTLRGLGGDLRLASVPPRVEQLFVLTRLSSVFQRFDSIEAAVASFGAADDRRPEAG